MSSQRQMVFVSGPRQVGKTTTCRNLASGYINWDNTDDRATVLRGPTAIADKLGIDKTLLGVDIVQKGKLRAKDVNERALLELLEEKKEMKIIVSPIGAQGFIFGRGNQQISDRVIERVGKDNIIVIATKSKLFTLNGEPMLVDTGNETVNQMLSGYATVTTGVKEKLVYKVSS